MKTLKIILALFIGVFLSTSCADEYLDTIPTDQTGTATVFETTENAKLAINGINKLMTRQYLGSQGFNGEGTIKMYYGNYPGNHFFVNLPGWASIINSDYHENTASTYDYYPWYYYYMLIANANSVILNIDAAAGPESEKQFIMAQALTYRAYSFFMLSQIYCNRWSDANGASKGIVLRVDLSNGDQALSTLAETYKQIYDDLDEAIRLYGLSGKNRGTNNYDPDIEVAYATYARAAITRQDYGTASTMAANARTGHPLMNNAQYSAGFYTPNQEWIWGSHGALDETLYFYSYQAYIAYNSTASAVRTYPKCISRELYDKIPSTDLRKNLFLDPAGRPYTTATGLSSTSSALHTETHALYPNMDSRARVYAYMQLKIACEDAPGVGHVNHFRSAEMYLIEAEAKYFLSDEPGARLALTTLNNTSGRDPSYTTANTGVTLLNEIKMYRAIELWGEGFDWFDMKRWGDSIDRKTFADGSNFIVDFTGVIGPNEKNKWTWMIPLKETDYNKLIGTGL